MRCIRPQWRYIDGERRKVQVVYHPRMDPDHDVDAGDNWTDHRFNGCAPWVHGHFHCFVPDMPFQSNGMVPYGTGGIRERDARRQGPEGGTEKGHRAELCATEQHPRRKGLEPGAEQGKGAERWEAAGVVSNIRHHEVIGLILACDAVGDQADLEVTVRARRRPETRGRSSC